MYKHGFWELLAKMAPATNARVSWSCTLADLQTYLRSEEFEFPDGVVRNALENAADWNPGFPWTVALDSEDNCTFRPRA